LIVLLAVLVSLPAAAQAPTVTPAPQTLQALNIREAQLAARLHDLQTCAGISCRAQP